MNQVQKVDALFQLWQQGLCPGGQILVRQKGKVIYENCFGYANLEHQIPITPETVFHVASVSKQVTALAILLLQEDGKLNIDDDVRHYLPELIQFAEPVSLRQMMNMVSGIRDQWLALIYHGVRIDDTITMRDTANIIRLQKNLNFAPGSRYLYSNSNFSLLAMIVEKLSGQSFGSFVKQRIFTPLGMDASTIRETYWQLINQRAYAYHDNGEGVFTWNVLNYGTYGATSLHTTARDLMKLLDHYRTPKIGKPETMALMMQHPTLTDGKLSIYGGGLQFGEYQGHAYLEHGGSDAAFRAHVMRLTEDDLDIVLLSNTQSMPMSLLARKIANIILDLPEETPDLQEYASEQILPPTAGNYLNLSGPEAFLIEEKDGLFYRGEIPLRHVKGNRYRLGYGLTEVLVCQDKLVSVTGAAVTIFIPSPDRKVDKVFAENCCGTYHSDEIATDYSISEKDGYLFISHFRHGSHRLYSLADLKDSYFAWNEDFNGVFRFQKDQTGRVTGLQLDGGRILGLQLQKIK